MKNFPNTILENCNHYPWLSEVEVVKTSPQISDQLSSTDFEKIISLTFFSGYARNDKL